MAEERPIDPIAEGKRIAGNYLSQLGWAREWRRVATQEIKPAWKREEMEEKFRKADEMEEAAEANFSSEYERIRKDPNPANREILAAIYKQLGNRTDLGFIGKRIVGRIKDSLRPL
ncbi:MAG: hypothetical protein WC624_01620 [Candidatus Margulisiibacteriota bacterium]